MRIVYLLNSLGVGGAERQALAIAERMAQRGHEAAILTLREKLPEEWETCLAVHRLGMRRTPMSFAASLVRARHFLCTFRPDVLHSHSFHANIFARLLRVLFPRTVAISTVHNVHEGSRVRMFAYRVTEGLTSRTAFVSQAAADRYLRIKAASRRKGVVILNAIDIAGLAPDGARRSATRAAMNLASEFVWLAAGRIAPAKDYPNLLHAFAKVRKRRPDVRLLVAGEGTALERTRSEALATELGLGASVQFLGLRRDLPALLDAADGFVLSSAWEGMPLALAEAMAMEKNVVATDVGGVRELMAEAGTIIPPRDSAALAHAMQTVMEMPSEVRLLQGRSARRRILEKFDVERRVSEWIALYEEVLRERE